MKQKVLNVFKPILFLAIGFVIFLGVQRVLVLKNQGSISIILNGFYALNDNSLDVLVLGPSHPVDGLTLTELYENSGVCGYFLGTGGTPIDTSYFLLKKAFRTQKPKVVLLDAVELFDNKGLSEPSVKNPLRRVVMDALPFDSVKWEMARAYAELPESHGFLSAVFPIIEYHERWSSLTARDFRRYDVMPYYAAGNVLFSTIRSADLSVSDSKYIIDNMIGRNNGMSTEYAGGIITQDDIEEPLYNPQFSDLALSYLTKMQELCEENDAELVLIKIPSLYFPNLHTPAWSTVKSDMTKQLAREHGLAFYDYMYDTEIIDFETDTADKGYHLNLNGAEKMTNCIGELLRDTYHLQPHKDNVYDEMLQKYVKFREVAQLEMETDISTYVETVSKKLDKCSLIIAASNEFTSGMTENDFAFLSEKFGLQMIAEGGYADSYLAVVDGGETVYEAVSNRKIKYDMSIGEKKVAMLSSGWFDGPAASIKINGIEYAQGGRGLNIVVYDKESGVVIDSVSFDTYLESKPASRNWTATDTYLRAYEKAVCFD